MAMAEMEVELIGLANRVRDHMMVSNHPGQTQALPMDHNLGKWQPDPLHYMNKKGVGFFTLDDERWRGEMQQDDFFSLQCHLELRDCPSRDEMRKVHRKARLVDAELMLGVGNPGIGTGAHKGYTQLEIKWGPEDMTTDEISVGTIEPKTKIWTSAAVRKEHRDLAFHTRAALLRWGTWYALKASHEASELKLAAFNAVYG